MENDMKNILYTVAIFILPLVFSSTFAQGGGPGNKQQRMQQNFFAMQERLNLSDQQSSDLLTLRQQHREQRQTIMNKYGLQKRQDKPGNQLDPNQFAAFKNEMQAHRIAVENNVANVLNAEQMKEWKNIRNKKWPKKMQQRQQKNTIMQ
jgi:hypothetical protein